MPFECGSEPIGSPRVRFSVKFYQVAILFLVFDIETVPDVELGRRLPGIGAGDDAAVAEAQKQLGPIEGAVVKWSYSFHSARTLTPEAACSACGSTLSSATIEVLQREANWPSSS